LRCSVIANRVEISVIRPPKEIGAFEFVVLARLRVVQLMRGCTPRIEGDFKTTTIAQLEVAAGKVTKAGEHGADGGPIAGRTCDDLEGHVSEPADFVHAVARMPPWR
jgi:hypothetical protein